MERTTRCKRLRTKNKDFARAAARNQHKLQKETHPGTTRSTRQQILQGALLEHVVERRPGHPEFHALRSLVLKTSHVEGNRGVNAMWVTNSVQLIEEIMKNCCVS